MEERHAEGAMVEAISGAKPARQAILGDASNRNEKSDILTSCLLVGGVLFGHWRSDTLFPLVIRGATRRTVRKHRAPKGALRRVSKEPTHHPIVTPESTERQKVH